MKIIILSTGYTPVVENSRRSVETSLFLLSGELAKRGHETLVADIACAEPRGASGVAFRTLWSPKITGSNIFSYLFKVLVFTAQLPLVLWENRDADIVQAYSQFPAIIATVFKKIMRSKFKVFYVACSPYLVMPAGISNWLQHTAVEKLALRGVDRAIIHTASGIDRIASRFGVNRDKMAIIPAGADLSRVKSHTPVGKTIIYPAVITLRKNQLAIVLAAPEVLTRHPDSRFVFVGPIEDNNYYGDLQDTAESLGILDSLSFTGMVSKKRVFELYSESTLMVFPTTFEMQGIVLVEAMACGLPVVASDIDVVRDVVGEDNALLFPLNDTKRLADAITCVLDDGELRDRLSRKGKIIAQRYSWERIAEDFEKEYIKCCVPSETD